MKPYQIALMKYGLKEITGKQDNPQIISMFDDLGYNGKALKDETSWCSALVCWCNMAAGYQHTGKLYANSWTEFDGVEEIDIKDIQLGVIVVFWRGSYDGDPISGTKIPKRHVAYFISFDPQLPDKYVNVLGGNQSNELKISKYYKSRIKGVYRPKLKPSI